MKFIIDIEQGITPNVAMECVSHVIRGGRVSDEGKSYCYLTIFETTEGIICVRAYKNKKSIGFSVTKYESKDDRSNNGRV